MTTVAIAEDGSLIQWTDEQYVQEVIPEMKAYVILPKINLQHCTDEEKKTLKAGDEVTVLSDWGTDGEQCQVVTKEGVTGVTMKGYIGYGYKILIGSEGTYLFHFKGANQSEFGTVSAKRYNEVAIVLEEDDGYLFVVTLDGRSGYIAKGGDYSYYCEECNQ